MSKSNLGRLSDVRYSSSFWALVILFCAAFINGGSSRADMQPLIVLRPLAFAICIYGIFSFRREHYVKFRPALLILLATVALIGLHLIPLPPAIWQALPGRDIIAQIDAAAGLGDVWRPFTLVPSGARNALFSLAIPAAFLIHAAQISDREAKRLFEAVLIMLAIGALWGSVQLTSGGGYMYEIASKGSPTGPFANRNHHAVTLALMIPMLAVWGSTPDKRGKLASGKFWIAMIGSLLLILSVLTTGSRAGFVILLFAIASVWFLVPLDEGVAIGRKRIAGRWLAFGIVLSVLVMVSLAILASRADSIDRLFIQDLNDNTRTVFWKPIADLIVQYLPLGSGAGSFVEVYQIYEPDSLLDQEYLNHAHNDFLEIAMTLGIPGILLLLFAFGHLASTLLKLVRGDKSRSRVRYARLSATVLIGYALASAVDYPLRAPLALLVFMMAVLWMNQAKWDETGFSG